MMDWSTFLKISHIIGTVLGVGGATMAEVFSFKLGKQVEPQPGQIDFIKLTFTMIRLGTVLLVLSGFGYLVMFRLLGREELLYSARLWVKMVITAVIILNAVAMTARKIPLWLGAGVSLTSWYAALILGGWRGLHGSFWQIMGWYIAAAVVVTAGLILLKRLMGVRV